MKGVKKVVQVGDSAVAVVADTWWHAKTALDALPIVWDEGANAKVSSASIADLLKEGLDAEQAFVGNQNGDVKAALAGAAKKVEAVYSYPYQNHAPHGADERHRALHGGQMRGLGAARRMAKPLSRLSSRRPVCRPTSARSTRSMLGGGFGRRGAPGLCARRPCSSPRRCRARRSSCSGRAKRT